MLAMVPDKAQWWLAGRNWTEQIKECLEHVMESEEKA